MTALALVRSHDGISGHLAYAEYSEHAHPFVFGTFACSLRDTPGITAENRRLYEHALKRLLREPGTRTVLVTPAGEPDELMGWAVASPTALVYVYVRFHYRRGKLGPHIGTALIELVTGDRASPAAIWTTDASRMAAHGFPLRYDLDENERFRQLAR
jgi:hypothetical protein